jgi:hypothetical protein
MFQARQELLEDEWLVVRHSGEIPEIALHSAFYYLTEDPTGPGLRLSVEEIQSLREAAATRYQEIIMRDLCFENRELTVYRGVRRAIFNWHRFVAFCERQNEDCHTLRQATAEAFLVLVHKVLRQASDQGRTDLNPAPLSSLLTSRSSALPGSIDIGPSLASVFNCTFHDLTLFGSELGIYEGQIPPEISQFCHE